MHRDVLGPSAIPSFITAADKALPRAGVTGLPGMLTPVQTQVPETLTRSGFQFRLNRGGDRGANNAILTIVLVRLNCDPATRAYVERRTREGLSKKDIMRCLKRYVSRELFPLLQAA